MNFLFHPVYFASPKSLCKIHAASSVRVKAMLLNSEFLQPPAVEPAGAVQFPCNCCFVFHLFFEKSRTPLKIKTFY